MGNLQFADYDEETAATEAEENSSGAEFMKLRAGRNILRFLPPAKGKRSPFRVVFQHFLPIPGAGANNGKSVVCPRLEQRQPCAVCEEVNRLRKTNNKADSEAANALFSRRRVFANVIDRNEEDKGPKVYAFGKTVHEQLLALRTDPTSGGNYTHPYEGIDVVIDKSGEGMKTKYKVSLARQSTPLHRDEDDAVMQDWIDRQKDLEDYAKLPNLDDVLKLLAGEAPGDDDDDKPAPRGLGKKPAAALPAKGGSSAPKKSAAASLRVNAGGGGGLSARLRKPKRVDDDLEEEAEVVEADEV